MKLRPVGKSLDKRSSQSAISIALRYINMKMCRVVLANILNVPKIRNIIEMSKFRRIFEAACKISDAPGVIKSNKEAVSMFCNISSERHFTKRLLFFLAAKITSSTGFKKNVVYLAKMAVEIGDFVCFLDFHDHPPHLLTGLSHPTCLLPFTP